MCLYQLQSAITYITIKMRRILAYILFGTGLLAITYFGNYSGTLIANKSIFYFIGILCFLSGWIILRFAPKEKESTDKKQIREMINQLKENGEKIHVELSKCEVKSNDYSEEQDKFSTGILATSYENDIQAWNTVLGDEMANVKTVDTYQSVLIYKHNYMRNDRTFISGIIPTEHTTLLFKLDNQKTTSIYVDKNDPTKYYFDLDFLLA
jgi:hypothetical protein